MRRIRLAGALGLLAILAFELAAMRGESGLWGSAAFTITLVVLSIATLGALLKRGRGPGWVGFAVFGWIYLLTVFVADSELITTHALDGIYAAAFKPPALPIVGGKQLTREEVNNRPSGDLDPESSVKDFLARDRHHESMRVRFATVGNWFLCLISGFIGALAGFALDPRRSPTTRLVARGPDTRAG